MKKTFYIGTPIYYANGVPHIGHSYSSLIADVIARYKRMDGYKVKFSAGVDENAQKNVLVAKEKGMSVMAFLDGMAKKHKDVWDGLDISYTDFVRTTDPRHHAFVQEILQKTYDNGDIYEGTYEWLYCVGCEAFKKETDLTPEGLCPDHLKKPDFITEKNYFFRLSKYQKRLEAFYASHPQFTVPNSRFKEMETFLREGLEDFSISRETSKFGIPLPFDETQVTYVWYDALCYYLTACQNGDERFWPIDLHVVGKEIARFHVIYWPAMLMAAGYELPKNVLVTGFLTIDGQKISKSIGNVIDPVEFSQKYSRDLMLLYLLTAFPIGQDGDFSESQAILTFNAKLANNIGNLLNRFIVLSLKVGGEIRGETDDRVWTARDEYLYVYRNAMEAYDLKTALECSFEFGDVLNKFIDTKKPWEKDMEIDREEIVSILYTLGEWLRTIALCLTPFFTDKMSELLVRIGCESSVTRLAEGEYEALIRETVRSFIVREKGSPLYMRIQ